MKLPDRIVFQGRTFRRPTKNSYRVWSRPARDRSAGDQECFGLRNIMRGGWHQAHVEFSTSYYTDEGWATYSLVVGFDSGTASITKDGRDCDGRLTESWEFNYINGKWVEVGGEVRDQFAEAAGY